MQFALFIGCKIPRRVQQYERSARAVLTNLGVEIQDIPQFNCCGYPMRNADFRTYILFSARNLALAEHQDLDIMTLCKCCFGSLKKANYLLKHDRALQDDINTILAKDGLVYRGGCEVVHFLSVLHKDVGLDSLKSKITRSYQTPSIATHYGCHALRPSDIMQFDDALGPVVFDQLVEATGALSIKWPLKLECCGAPAMGINDDLSMDLAERKLSDAEAAGAEYICVGCPWCQAQFDIVQDMIIRSRGKNHRIPSIVYPQLLGLAMGLDRETLGMEMNHIDISGIERYLS